MSEKKKDTDDWMGILPDAERADVLKKQIEQEGQTERSRISEKETTERDFGTQFVRGLAVLGLVAVAVAAIAAWRSVHAPPVPPHTLAPASSAPQGKP